MFYNNFTDGADCPQKLKKGIDYIQKNYERSDLSLGDISSFLRMRRESVCRLWKKYMSVRITDFVNNLRIEKAKKLLLNDCSYISNIAYRVGLTPKYFSTLFKKRESCTPREYREVNSGKVNILE